MSYIGNTVQKSQKLTYNVPCGGIRTKPCETTNNIPDWKISMQECGAFTANQPTCASLDFADCKVGLNDSKQDPLLKMAWNEEAPNISCTYDPLKMTSLNVIENYKSKFGETEDYDTMMTNFCSGLGKKCITDPTTGKPFTICSKLKSGDNEGDVCRMWFNKKNLDIQDTTVTNYCFKHETAPDCKCLNRLQDQSYKTVKKHSTFNDGCWYPPCVGQSAYLVTSDLKKPTCPSNLCQIVFEELQNKDVNINDVKNSINCDFKLPSPPEVTPQPPPIFPPTIFPPTPPNNRSAFFLIGIIALAGGLGFFFYRRNKRRF